MPFIWMPTVFCPKLVLWEVFRLLKAEAFMSLGQVRTSNFRDQRWGCRDEQGGYARPDSWDSLKRAECDAPAPWQNGTVNGVQVSVCSSDCRVHSRGASPRILSNFPGGPASNTIPLLRASTLPKPQTITASARCPQAGSAAIRYSSFSTLQILFRVLSAHKSSILSSASLLTCERIDLAQHQPPTLHLGADALERSRHHLIHDEHKTFPSRCKAAGC